MNSRVKASAGVGVLLLSSLGLSMVALRESADAREHAILKEALYIPTSKTIKALSLGYTGLMADLYWTRVVQYFGGKHYQHAEQYKLLAPLLDITTTLDPHLLVAYEFGSIFLSQKPPEGAGDPAAAAALVKKGIRENPEAWRLWYHLGYIYYDELHDSKAASEAFLEGSRVPGALPWMKVMAAALAQHAGEAETAHFLWTQIYNSTDNPDIRANAVNRLIALRVDGEVERLQAIAERYQRETGGVPASFLQLVEAGYLARVPVDPRGDPYLLVEGRVQVSRPESLPFITRGLPAGWKPSIIAPSKIGS
jgi:tetratricopeptide (TPR) repeat protein